MAYSIDKSSVVPYPASELRRFYRYGVEWIDNLHFLHDPKDFPFVTDEHIEVAKELFRDDGDGWDGDGEIQLLWLPAFVFPLKMKVPWEGVVLWHVKQIKDGLSWLLSAVELPFEEFSGTNSLRSSS